MQCWDDHSQAHGRMAENGDSGQHDLIAILPLTMAAVQTHATRRVFLGTSALTKRGDTTRSLTWAPPSQPQRLFTLGRRLSLLHTLRACEPVSAQSAYNKQNVRSLSRCSLIVDSLMVVRLVGCLATYGISMEGWTALVLVLVFILDRVEEWDCGVTGTMMLMGC